MANTTDYLLASVGRAGLWVKLHNNATTVDYFSTAQSDTNGAFTHAAPEGYYTVYTSNKPALPGAGDPSWIATGDSNYLVGTAAGAVITTQDDLIVGGAGGVPARLGKGGSGTVLTVDPGTGHLAWDAPSGSLTNPMTTLDDIIVAAAAGVPGRLAKGAGGSVLTVDAGTGHVAWDPGNPMTTQDDIIIGGASGVQARLAKGTDGQVLTVDPATHHVQWDTPSAGGGTASQLVAQFNDSTTNLTQGQQFVGTARDTGNNLGAAGAGYSRFRVFVYVDRPGSMEIQYSPDAGVSWFTTMTRGVPASAAQVYESIVVMRHCRVRYTNAASGPGSGTTTVLDINSTLVAL